MEVKIMPKKPKPITNRHKPNKMVRIQIDIYDQLVPIADKKHVSNTWLINDILRRYVEKESGQ